MKQKNKATRIFAVLLSLMMLFSIAACGGSEEQGTTDTKKETDVQEKSETEETGEKAKITVAVYDRGNIDPSEGTVENNRWTQWINENAPVEVEFIAIPRSTPADKYATLFASNSAPDLVMEYDASILGNLVANGSLMPLNDVVEQYSTTYKELLDKYPAMEKMGTVDGNLYYLTRAVGASTNHVIMIRQDWLDKIGMELPTTADELYAVAEAFAKQDPDGNGEDDTYGFALTGNTGSQINFMFGLYSDTSFIDADGEYIFPWERLATATQFKKDLFDNKIISQDYASDSTGEQAQQDFINGKLGIFTLNNGVLTGSSIIENFYENNPDAELSVMALPESEYGQYNTAINTPVQVVGAVNANCQNPEAVMQYLDWLNTEEVYNTLKYGGELYCSQDEAGNWIPNDQETYNKEAGYLSSGDYSMACSTLLFTQVDPTASYDAGTKAGEEMIAMYADAKKAYLGENAFARDVLYAQPAPVLDSELSIISGSTFGAVEEYYKKAILSGDSYTVEMAEQDAKKLVEDGNGQMVLDFYETWYAEASLVTIDDYNAFLE